MGAPMQYQTHASLAEVTQPTAGHSRRLEQSALSFRLAQACHQPCILTTLQTPEQYEHTGRKKPPVHRSTPRRGYMCRHDGLRLKYAHPPYLWLCRV